MEILFKEELVLTGEFEDWLIESRSIKMILTLLLDTYNQHILFTLRGINKATSSKQNKIIEN